jgi:hypothetical protein
MLIQSDASEQLIHTQQKWYDTHSKFCVILELTVNIRESSNIVRQRQATLAQAIRIISDKLHK